MGLLRILEQQSLYCNTWCLPAAWRFTNWCTLSALLIVEIHLIQRFELIL